MSENLKTAKFGGSSLAEAGQFRKVIDIIKSDPSRRYIVASAPGKRYSGDFKVTDKLYECYELASRGNNIDEVYHQFENRYRDIVEGLGMDCSLDEEFRRIKMSVIHNAGRDYAASRGEYLNAKILAEYLGYEFIDAREVIFFHENGTLDTDRTYTTMAERLRGVERAVIPGFYGSMPNDTIRTFSRGGSDITGAIVARATGSDLYENWTDVSGVLMADPRIVEDPEVIDIITYNELRELSYMGATVLHEDAIFPVRLMGIPINIRNTNKPEDPGTMIVASAEGAGKNVITGIAGKPGFSSITIEKDMMNSEVGFTRKVLSVLESEGISFEHMPSGIDTLSIILATPLLEGKKERILRAICDAVSPDSVFVEDSIALIAVVGRGMRSTKGTAARTLDAVAGAGINLVMIDQGSSELNIILGVKEADLQKTIAAIYGEFGS